MEAVLGGLGWGEEGAQEAREVTIDGGVGERRERFGVLRWARKEEKKEDKEKKEGRRERRVGF